MTGLTALCTLLAVGALLIILSYIAWEGIGSLNFRFLTESPKPVGEGGGIGNAILGSLWLLLLSSVFGLPIGIAVGVYLSEIGRGRIGGAVRFIVDTLTGIRESRAGADHGPDRGPHDGRDAEARAP